MENSFSQYVQTIVEAYINAGLMVAVAESCTGGMIAAALTEIAGSSAMFDRGFVTYSNEAKQDMLGVPPELIAEFGAVSEEVARAMAMGALVLSKADIAVSVTGIAGPGGATVEKPVGTVWFGLAITNNETETVIRQFRGDRAEVRRQAVEQALELLKSRLLSKLAN